MSRHYELTTEDGQDCYKINRLQMPSKM